MGGGAVDDDLEITFTSSGSRTVVLVGKAGNGKSATGNTILGRKAFIKSTTCELQTTVLCDGQVVNVIDTPGLFDLSAESDFVDKEVVKCINLAKDGIHAVLVVFSVRTRFSQEDQAVLRSLQTLFGNKIVNYVILVFTGGDELDENDQTLDDYLGCECPEPLKDILTQCENRMVLFDNKTRKDSNKKINDQVQQLLSLVNKVLVQNGGHPYTDKIFAQVKTHFSQQGAMKLRDQQEAMDSSEWCSRQEISDLKKQMELANEVQLKQTSEAVVSSLREATTMLQQQLAEEQAGREEFEKFAQQYQERAYEDIRKLRVSLVNAQEKIRCRSKNNQNNRERRPNKFDYSRNFSTLVRCHRQADLLTNSATWNIILGEKAFKSKASWTGVTSTCKLQRTLLSDRQVFNVIDTPGLFDSSVESEFISREIVEYINLAKDGIYALFLVFSVRTYFTKEEEAAIRSLQTLFGSKIVSYTILVFTGGDALENDQTLEDYLGEFSEPLKDICTRCENRLVLFDNKTEDESKKVNQVQQLLSLVNKVIEQNGGQLYTNEIFAEVNQGSKKLRDQQEPIDSLEGYSEQHISRLKEQLQLENDEQLNRISETIASRLREATARLEEQLAEEKAARVELQKSAQQAQEMSNEELSKLRVHREQAQEELRRKGNCAIL
ncbi:AIG1-type guanine nucleotide-binding (G) domain containing protein [Trema orientale]|uniref:AIG1-type guanine nucleotide-binding (G) domain containing protein n=1 Tax=Trema orientale TaxID=63057 RepID=A0A2P5E7H5_TREOI|nr:AIG1-type guanine nucleotide-binding (G) domain containing protein [Trema orientale]